MSYYDQSNVHTNIRTACEIDKQNDKNLGLERNVQ